MSLVGAVLTTGVVVAVGGAPAATADERLTLDVLKVVDGRHVVETVEVAAATAAATETSLEARPEVVDADVAVWGGQGWERGRLGYPVGQAACSAAGSCTQRFQGGTASWSTSTAVRLTYR